MCCCVPPSKVSGASLILVRISYTKMDMSSVPMKPRNLSTNELLDRIATSLGITGTLHSRRKAAKYRVELEGKGISVQVLYAFWWVRRNPQTSGQQVQHNNAHNSMAAQPPATAVQPTGVAPSTGGQSAPQSTPQTSVANLWTVDKLYGFIAGELNFDPKGPLSLVDMAKQHCFEKGITPTKIELHAYWQRLKKKNALDTWCWVIGMTSLCLPLLCGAMYARIESDLVWTLELAQKHPKAYEADMEFVSNYWRFAVLVLLLCSTLLYFKCKLRCALPPVLMYAAVMVYHYCYKEIDFCQMTDLSLPLMYCLLFWWFLLKAARHLLSLMK